MTAAERPPLHVGQQVGGPALPGVPDSTSIAIRESELARTHECLIAGTVTGTPRRWLRLEAATLLAVSMAAYLPTHEPWWLFALIVLTPDIAMIAYLGGNRLGAHLYNLAHTTPVPATLIGLGWWQHTPIVLALGLIWTAHIALDRLLGYGLKYGDHFQHTHLGRLGREDG